MSEAKVKCELKMFTFKTKLKIKTTTITYAIISVSMEQGCPTQTLWANVQIAPPPLHWYT